MGPSQEVIDSINRRLASFESWLLTQQDQQYPAYDDKKDEQGNKLYFSPEGAVLYATKESEENLDEEEFVYGDKEAYDHGEGMPEQVQVGDKAYPLAKPEAAILRTFLLWAEYHEKGADDPGPDRR